MKKNGTPIAWVVVAAASLIPLITILWMGC
jgi:hypothetical protein